MAALANISSDFISEYDIVWEVAGTECVWYQRPQMTIGLCDKNSLCVWTAPSNLGFGLQKALL